MKIVVDQNVPLAEELFGAHGDLVFVDGRDINPEMLIDAKALICRSVTPVTAQLLKGSSVAFVGSCTIGIDHLDISYLTQTGISWAHAPGCNAQSVVEYVVSSLAALRSIKPGLSAGVVGCGRVGGAVFQELERLGISVRGYDPFLARDPALNQRFSLTDLDEVLATDILCLHTPWTDSGEFPTDQMIGEKALLRLNTNAVLVSAGRGGVVQEKALLSVAKRRPDIRWVLDVWENEPDINSDTLEIATIATPHIAGYSLEGKQKGSRQIYQSFCEYFGLIRVTDSPEPGETFTQLQPSASIEELLLDIYDPRQDDARMRVAQRSQTEERLQRGAWFDALRKNYPERRERSFYRCSFAGMAEGQQAIARALGMLEPEMDY